MWVLTEAGKELLKTLRKNDPRPGSTKDWLKQLPKYEMPVPSGLRETLLCAVDFADAHCEICKSGNRPETLLICSGCEKVKQQSAATSSNQKQSEAIRSNPKQSTTVRSDQKQPVAISSNQRQSALTSSDKQQTVVPSCHTSIAHPKAFDCCSSVPPSHFSLCTARPKLGLPHNLRRPLLRSRRRLVLHHLQHVSGSRFVPPPCSKWFGTALASLSVCFHP